VAASWDPPAPGETASWTKTVTAEDVALYARVTGDENLLHFDEDFTRATRFGRLISHGGITTGLFHALIAMKLPGPGSVFLHQEWDFPAPVYIGDTITAQAVVVEARADKPITRLDCVVRNQDGVEVLRGACVVYTALSDRQ
jgi:acyl dehydratase